MRELGRFFADKRGSSIESISLMAGIVAFAAIAGAHFLDQASQDGSLAELEPAIGAHFSNLTANLPRPQSPGASLNRQVTLDYTPVGSIPNTLAQPVTLNPCSDNAR